MAIRILSKELQEKAITELNEDPKRTAKDIQALREWIHKQPHLTIEAEDQWLLSMLRGCKFSLQRTKQKLDLLCSMKSMAPEFFQNRDPFLPEIQEILNLGLCLPLSKTKDPAAPRVILFRIKSTDPDKIRIESGVKVILMILDILFKEDDNFIIAGVHLFIDDSGVSINHLLQITPTILKKTYTCIADAFAVRPKGVHAINVPQFAKVTFNTFKALLSEKVLDRVSIQGVKKIAFVLVTGDRGHQYKQKSLIQEQSKRNGFPKKN